MGRALATPSEARPKVQSSTFALRPGPTPIRSSNSAQRAARLCHLSGSVSG